MIPKIIHYCWLSDEPFPDMVRECIDSWKRILPDYEIIKWDRSRFDVNSVPWVKDAYAAKKYAFCADYIRIYALYTMGGIYLDSDVMVFRPFDEFLHHKSFSSAEFHRYMLYKRGGTKPEELVGIEAAIIGAEAKQEWQKLILDEYMTKPFIIKPENVMPRIIAKVLHKHYGFQYYPTFQRLDKIDFNIYPPDVFSCRAIGGGVPIIKYTTHLGANSWGNNNGNLKKKIKNILKKMHLLKFIHNISGIHPIVISNE